MDQAGFDRLREVFAPAAALLALSGLEKGMDLVQDSAFRDQMREKISGLQETIQVRGVTEEVAEEAIGYFEEMALHFKPKTLSPGCN